MSITKQDCVNMLVREGRSELEARDTVDGMMERKKRIEADGKLARGDEALADAVRADFDEARIEMAARQRQEQITIKRRIAMQDFIDSSKEAGVSFMGALEARLVGNPQRMFGARQSIDANRAAIFDTFINHLEKGVSDIAERNNMTRGALFDLMAKDKSFRADFVRERMEPNSTQNAMIRDVVELYDKISEEMRMRLNDAGAGINRLEGRLPQSHDQLKILGTTRGEWVAFVEGRIDTQRSFPDATPDEVRTILGNIYDTIGTGKDRGLTDMEVPAIRTPRNIASRLGRHRVLHFKDADSYMSYMDRFGRSNLWEAIIGEMEGSARKLSLMETLGPNPEHMIRTLLATETAAVRRSVEAREVDAKTAEKQIKAIEKSYTGGNYPTGQIARWLSVLTGETQSPVNVGVAKAFGIVRSIQSTGKLGMATLSSVSDLFTKAMNMRTNGANLLEAHGRTILDLVKAFSPEEKRLLNDLGFYFDLENGALIHRFDMAETIPGKMTAFMNKFFKYSGLTGWTEKNKAGMAQWLSNTLGESRNFDFASLHPDVRAMLEYHGFGPDRWDVFRKHMVEEFGGKRYMNPSLARNLTDAQIAHLLPEHLKGQTPKGYTPELWRNARQNEFNRLRTEIETQTRAFYGDEAKFAVIEPDAKTTATMTQGTRPGTAPGEAMRMIMQFKSFPIAFWQRTVSGRRWIRGSMQEGMRYGGMGGVSDAFTRDTVGMVNYMASAMVYGYIAMTLKDLAKNRTPRDPNKVETWFAAALQSGGAGIYGDFFLGKANRFGNDFLETLAGPTLGNVADIANALTEAVHGDPKAAGDTLIKVGMGNVPYGNLWYTKYATDYLFFDNIKEWMSPGYKRRMARNMRKEYGQENLFQF